MPSWSIPRAGRKILSLLEKSGVEIQDGEAAALRRNGIAVICGYICKTANVRGTRSFRVIVCPSWFRASADIEKPSINTSSVKFDFQLFPTQKYLFALYYRALRDYALQVEKDRQKWFCERYWGMEIDDERGLFVWKGHNTKQFPLLVVSSPLDLDLHVKQYEAQAALVSATSSNPA